MYDCLFICTVGKVLKRLGVFNLKPKHNGAYILKHLQRTFSKEDLSHREMKLIALCQTPNTSCQDESAISRWMSCNFSGCVLLERPIPGRSHGGWSSGQMHIGRQHYKIILEVRPMCSCLLYGYSHEHIMAGCACLLPKGLRSRGATPEDGLIKTAGFVLAVGPCVAYVILCLQRAPHRCSKEKRWGVYQTVRYCVRICVRIPAVFL